MIAAGLGAALLGHRMLRIVLAGLAFLVGAAGAMYPIDAIFGDMLCGTLEETRREAPQPLPPPLHPAQAQPAGASDPAR